MRKVIIGSGLSIGILGILTGLGVHAHRLIYNFTHHWGEVPVTSLLRFPFFPGFADWYIQLQYIGISLALIGFLVAAIALPKEKKS